MKISRAIPFFVLACSLPALASATLLSTIADSMTAGTWAEIPTNGFNQNLLWLSKDNGDCVFNYSDDMTWNPATQELYYLGGSHYGPGRQIVYSCSTNTWRQLPDQTWMPNLGHGYDHNALDPNKQIFFHWPMSVRQTIYRMRISDGVWYQYSILDNIETWGDLACCRGLEFFPELDQGSLLMCNGKTGKMISFSTKTGRFRTLATELRGYLGAEWMGGYHNIVKYNHKYKICIAGGGVGSRRLWTVDSLGTVSPLPIAPYDVGIFTTATVCDPVTGDILMLAANGQMYSFSFEDSTWTTEPSTSIPVFNLGNRNIIFTVCGPIPDHNVTVWCKYTHSGAKVFLYKRAEPVSAERRNVSTPKLPLTVNITPNPVTSSTIVSGYSATDRISLAIYTINGKKIWESSPSISGGNWFTTCFSPENNPGGTYLLRASNGNGKKVMPFIVNK